MEKCKQPIGACKFSISTVLCRACFYSRFSINSPITGCSSVWLERLVWDQEAVGSNPITPMKKDFYNIFINLYYISRYRSSAIILYGKFGSKNSPFYAFFSPQRQSSVGFIPTLSLLSVYYQWVIGGWMRSFHVWEQIVLSGNSPGIGALEQYSWSKFCKLFL